MMLVIDSSLESYVLDKTKVNISKPEEMQSAEVHSLYNSQVY